MAAAQESPEAGEVSGVSLWDSQFDSATDLSQLRDIGALAAWSVSSSKPNYGVEHLSDPNIKTLWQYAFSITVGVLHRS